MRIAGFWMGMLMGLAGFSAQGATEIQENDGVFEIVNDGEVAGTFWNSKTGGSDVKFVAEKGAKPGIFWSADHKYLAANGGPADNRTVYLYEIGDGKNWTPVAPPGLSDEQLAPLNAIAKWTGSGTEAVRWDLDGTLLLRIWAEGADKKIASIWANLELKGDAAKVVGTSTEEPMSAEAVAETSQGTAEMKAPPGDSEEVAAAMHRLDPEKLVGEHDVLGRNPDGSEYKGTVAIRVKGGLLLFQWKVGDTTTHGTGFLEDMTVGVALENGVAIYQAVPQAEGISLVGLWKPEGAKSAMEETILVGNADMTTAKFEVRKVNGDYQFRRQFTDGSALKGRAEISGGDVVKQIAFELPDDDPMKGEGLQLGDGLAVITPEGLAVYALSADNHYVGESVNGAGKVSAETLVPNE